jgi:hypothetical protein
VRGVVRRGEATERKASACARPPFSEFGHIGLVDPPFEEIEIAGPRVHQAAAHFAREGAGTPGRQLFLGRAVGQRATGTAEIFDGEKTACHPAMMLRTTGLSSPTVCDSQRPATRIVEAGGVRASNFLTRRIRRVRRPAHRRSNRHTGHPVAWRPPVSTRHTQPTWRKAPRLQTIAWKPPSASSHQSSTGNRWQYCMGKGGSVRFDPHLAAHRWPARGQNDQKK